MSDNDKPVDPEVIKKEDDDEFLITKLDESELSIALETGIVQLIHEKPFFGLVLTKMRRMESKAIPTMGVRPTDQNHIQLLYSQKFVERLDPTTEEGLSQLKAVLEHEVLHCVGEHFIRRSGRKPDLWNYATDIAINQYVDNLPEDCLVCPEECEKGREAEYYYSHPAVEDYKDENEEQSAKNNCPVHGDQNNDNNNNDDDNNNQDNGNQEQSQSGTPCDDEGCNGGCGQHDADADEECTCQSGRGDHSGWDNLDGNMEAQSNLEDIIRSAYEESLAHGRGTLGSAVEEMVKRMLQKPLRWQNRLRRNIAEEVSADQETTYRRPHRRRDGIPGMGIDDLYPGMKRQPSSQIYVAFDTSGSISSEDLAEFLNEIAYLNRSHDILLIHCDADITKVEKYNGQNEISCHGRGGTCFKPVLNYLRDGRIEEGNNINHPPIRMKSYTRPSLIYFTDGWGENPEDDGYSKKFDTLWVICRNGSKDRCAQFGTFIDMEEHRKM